MRSTFILRRCHTHERLVGQPADAGTVDRGSADYIDFARDVLVSAVALNLVVASIIINSFTVPLRTAIVMKA